jgi:drug/metabolite transporter (DMT)-like permease
MYVALCAAWGTTWLVIKIGLRDLPPLWFGGIRMALACALIAPFAFAAGSRHGASQPWRPILWSGFLQIGVNYACVFVAEQWIESGLAAMLFATFPIFIGLIAHVMLPDEPLTRRTATSAGLGLLGVAVIEAPVLANLFASQTRMRVAGSALVLLASLVAAYANVFNKRHLPKVPPAWNVWLQTLSGSAFLLALAVVFEPGAPLRWTPSSVGALVYLAVFGTALPFAGLFWLLHRVPLSVIGTIPVVDTVIAVVLGSLILGESFSLRVLAGAALILVAVLLAGGARRPVERSP